MPPGTAACPEHPLFHGRSLLPVALGRAKHLEHPAFSGDHRKAVVAAANPMLVLGFGTRRLASSSECFTASIRRPNLASGVPPRGPSSAAFSPSIGYDVLIRAIKGWASGEKSGLSVYDQDLTSFCQKGIRQVMARCTLSVVLAVGLLVGPPTMTADPSPNRTCDEAPRSS